MNYHARYGLEFNPFIKNSKDILVENSEYKEAIYRLNYLANNKGIGVLTGNPGRGKTTTLRYWSSTLNRSRYKVIYIALSTLTVIEFYKQLAEAFDLDVKFRKRDNFKAIQDAINRNVLEKHITPVIILDEANYINTAILNDLKMLFGFEMDSSDRTIVILAGLPQLNNTLRLAVHEPLRQRITMNYHLEGLNKEEARTYILKKLEGAGCHQEVFEANAIEAIINSANGAPRVINKICDTALFIGDNKKQETIDSDLIMLVINDLELA